METLRQCGWDRKERKILKYGKKTNNALLLQIWGMMEDVETKDEREG